MKRGFTLIELLVVVGITAVVTLGAVRAYVEGVTFDERVRSSRGAQDRDRLFRDRVTELIRGAYVTILPDDTASCFIGETGTGETAQNGSIANTLTLTTFGGRLPSRVVVDQDDDFETLNTKFGPQGGLAEVSISATPVGQPEGEIQGIYLRVQRPADGDPTQGGFEEQLKADVSDIQFEFFDGLAWQSSWDTRTMTTKRLPAAVRVTYTLEGEDNPRVLVVRIPHSDVTPQNPVGEAG